MDTATTEEVAQVDMTRVTHNGTDLTTIWRQPVKPRKHCRMSLTTESVDALLFEEVRLFESILGR